MCSVKTRPKPGLASMRSRSAAGIRVAAGWYSNRTAEVVELTSKEAYPTHGDFAETAPGGFAPQDGPAWPAAPPRRRYGSHHRVEQVLQPKLEDAVEVIHL